MRLRGPLAKVLVGALFPIEALLATPRRPEYGGADGGDGGLAGLMLGLICSGRLCGETFRQYHP